MGRGVECASKTKSMIWNLQQYLQEEILQGVTILDRRRSSMFSADDAGDWKDKIDVLILCGGSATDLPEQTPKYAKMFQCD